MKMTCTLVVAAGIAFLASPVAWGDMSSLIWEADEGVRVSGGPIPAVKATFVMQRPDGLWGMYYYLGNAVSYGDTGYSVSSDGVAWSAPITVMRHGEMGYDNVDAVIHHIVTLPNGQYRAYCAGMQSNQGSAPTSIFYADSPDGINWTKGSVMFTGSVSAGQVGSPHVSYSDGLYTIFFTRGASVQRATSTDGLSWGSPETVITGGVNSFDIVSCAGGGYRMFAGTAAGDIGSLHSSEGLSWTWDPGARLTRSDFGIGGSIWCPVVAEINDTEMMFVSARPSASNTRENIYSATAVPEPLSAVLGVIGLSMAGAFVRKRREDPGRT